MRGDLELTPFVVGQAPLPGESLIGFVSRVLCATPVRSISAVLKLVDHKLTARNLNTTAFSSASAERFATLFGLSDEERLDLCRPRLERTTSLRINKTSPRPAHSSLANRGRRRVSPLALRTHAFHREIWDNPALSFDPETLELLVDTCPLCKKSLGWRRAVHAYHCDACLDRSGRSHVDLREASRSSLVETADPEALRVFADLMSPWHYGAKKRLVRILARRWRPSQFEALGQIAFFMADTLRLKDREIVATSPLQLPISAIAYAGRAILSGQEGLGAALCDIRDPAYKSWGRTMSPWELSPTAKAILSKATGSTMERVVAVPRRGPRSPVVTSRRPDMVHRLREDPARDYGRRILPVLTKKPVILPHALEIDRVRDILGISLRDIRSLINSGDILACSPYVLSQLPHENFISAASMRQFMLKVIGTYEGERTSLGWALVSLRDFNKRTRPYELCDIMRALARNPEIPRFNISSPVSSCWLDTTCVVYGWDLEKVLRSASRSSTDAA